MSLPWKCHVAALVVSVGVAGPIAWQVFDRTLPFERTSGLILPPDPHPGSQMTVKWEGRINRHCSGTIRREIIDSQGKVHQIADVPSDITVLVSPTSFKRTFTLPSSVVPGPAFYKSTSYFVCNWTQRWWPIKGEFPAIPFNVQPFPEDMGAKPMLFYRR